MTLSTSLLAPARAASWPAWLEQQRPRRDAVGTLARALGGTDAAAASSPGALLDVLAAAGDLERLPALAIAAREYTAGDGGTVADGYLHRTTSGWRVAVACPSCNAWHFHGAGRGDFAAGAVLPRVSHCADFHAYSAIRIQPATWEGAWATSRGNRSAMYRRHVTKSARS